MRIISIAVICAGAAWVAGCVTEGGLALEPESDEEQAQANLRVGVAYLQEERPEFAIDALLRALEIDPRLADAHSAIALAYDQTGDAELAEQHYRRATELAPSSAAPHNALGVFLCRQDRWDDARPYYQRAIELAGNRGIDYMANAAVCARSSGDLDSAIAYYRSVLDIEATNPDALRAIVQTLIQREDYLTGRAFWQRLERNGPLNAEDYLSCYVIEAGSGDNLAAGQCAARLREEFPGSPALRQLSLLEENGGR